MIQLSSCEKTWNNHECILLKEISQSEKSGYAVYNYTLGCTPETKATLKISYTSTSIFEKILNGSGKKRIAFPLGRLDPS